MAASCPSKKDPRYSEVSRFFDEKEVRRIFIARGKSFDGIISPEALMSEIGFDPDSDSNDIDMLNKILTAYNNANNTMHSVVQDENGKPVLSVNYYPQSDSDTYIEFNEINVNMGKGYVVRNIVPVPNKEAIDKIDEFSKVIDGDKGFVAANTDATFNYSEPVIPYEEFDTSRIGEKIDEEGVAEDFSVIKPPKDVERTVGGTVKILSTGSTDIAGDKSKLKSRQYTAKKKLDNIIKILDARIKMLEASISVVDNEEAKVLREKVRNLKTLYENKTYASAINDIFDILENNVLTDLEDAIDKFGTNPDTFVPAELEQVRNKSITAERMLQEIAELSAFGSVGGKLLSKDENFKARYENANKIVRDVNTLVKGMQDQLIEKLGEEEGWTAEEIAEVQDKVNYDTSMFGAKFGPLRALKDQVLRTAYSKISEATRLAQTTTYEEVKPFAKVLLDWEKQSDGDTTVFYEKGADGKFTGYLTTDLKWGEYYAAEEKMYLELNELLGIDKETRYFDTVAYNSATKEVQDKVDKIYGDFKKNHMRSENGRYVPNPKTNEEHKKRYKNDSAYKKAHDALMKLNHDIKTRLPKQFREDPKKFYLAPQLKKTTAEIIYKNRQGSRFKDYLRIHVLEKSLLGSETDIASGENDLLDEQSSIILDANGHAAKLPPVFYTNKLSNMDHLSTDIIGSMALLSDMSNNYMQKSAVMPTLTLLQHALADRTVMKGFGRKQAVKGLESNTYKALTDFLDINLYGIAQDKIVINVAGHPVRIDKFVRSWMDYGRKVNLFMNIPAIVSGYIKGGIIDTKIDDLVGHNTSQKSAHRANMLLLKHSGAIAKQTYSRHKTDPILSLMERLGVLDDISDQYNNMHMKKKLQRVQSSDLFYGPYTTADARVRMKSALSIMDNMRWIDGKFMTYKQFKRKYEGSGMDIEKKWDSYENQSILNMYETDENGVTKVKKEFRGKLTHKKEASLMQMLSIEGARYAGNITRFDRPAISRSIFGNLAMMHRNWMISGFTERFAVETSNELTGEKTIGFHRGFLRVGMIYYKEFGAAKRNLGAVEAATYVWNTLEPHEKLAFHKTLLDIGAMVLAYALKELIGAMVDDEEENGGEPSNFAYYLAYQANRLYIEQTAFTSLSLLEILDSPTPMQNFIPTLSGAMDLFTNGELEHGPYEGLTPFERFLIKKSFVKNLYEMRNFKDRNRYYESLVMNSY